MVHIEILVEFKRLLKYNLDKYALQHGGEYVLFEGSAHNPKISFFESKPDLEIYLSKYQGKIGDTFFYEYVPTGKELTQRRIEESQKYKDRVQVLKNLLEKNKLEKPKDEKIKKLDFIIDG